MEVREPVVRPEVRARLVRRLARRGATQEDAEDAVQDAWSRFLAAPRPRPALRRRSHGCWQWLAGVLWIATGTIAGA